MNGSIVFSDFVCGAGVDASGAGAVFDDDAASAALTSFDLDRAGGSSGTAGGVAEELRPRAGLLLGAGATTTASGGSADLEPARSFFSALLTDVEAGRFGVGPEPTLDAGCGAGVASGAALDELDAAPGVREALLLLALAFAVGGCAEGSRLAARGFAAALVSAAAAAMFRFGTEGALGTEAARAGSSFGAGFSFCISREDFRLASSPAVSLRVSFVNPATSFLILLSTMTGFLILPLPGVRGGPPCGGGAMPAGVSPGPGTMCIINSFSFCIRFAALPAIFVPFAVFRTASVFTACRLLLFLHVHLL